MTDLQEMQQQIKQCQEHIQLSESLDRLKINPDFKRLIQHYTHDLSVSLVLQLSKADRTSEVYLGLMDRLYAISHFNTYLEDITKQGQVARADIEALRSIPLSEHNDE